MTSKHIDKDLQSILRPLNMMQAMFFCTKYRIQDDIISENSFRYYIFSSFGILLNIVLFTTSMINIISPTNRSLGKTIVEVGQKYSIVSNSFGFLINYYTNVIHRHRNVLLVCKIQKIHKFLKFRGRKFIIVHWFYVILFHCLYVYFLFSVYLFHRAIDVETVIVFYVSINFDFNILYAKSLLKILCSSVRIWTEDLRRSGYLTGSDYEDYWENMFEVFMEIFKVYRLIEKTFQGQVSNIDLIFFKNMLM